MTTQGGIVETKQIGIPINLNGQFVNTEVKNGAIQLKKIENSTEYYKTGSWTSEIIDIGDNFKEYENLVATITQQDGSNDKIYTSSSENGVDFTEWAELGSSNEIISPKNRFFKVKINLTAGSTISNIFIANFNSDLIKDNFTKSEWIDTLSGLQLRKEYDFIMSKDISWTDIGSLHRKKITRSEWLRIDKLNISNGGV